MCLQMGDFAKTDIPKMEMAMHKNLITGFIVSVLSLFALCALPASAQAPNIGLGPQVHTALGGFILGYDIDSTGTEGLLAESVSLGGGKNNVAVETFDQKTGKI